MHVGPIVSSDLFYNPDEGQYERWSKRGVLAVEMEAAALFTVGALRGVAVRLPARRQRHRRRGRVQADLRRRDEGRGRPDDARRARRPPPPLATPSSSSTRRPRTAPPGGAGPRSRTAPAQRGWRATRSSPSGRASSATLAREAADGGAKLLVVVGGDGSVNEVANGIAGRDDVEVAVIPRGTGRDFVRTYGIPHKLDGAIDVALDRRRRARSTSAASRTAPGTAATPSPGSRTSRARA